MFIPLIRVLRFSPLVPVLGRGTTPKVSDKNMYLNFQIADGRRSTKFKFIKNQKYDVGKNILLNRMHILNDRIEKSLIDLTLTSYKVKCKELFLKG